MYSFLGWGHLLHTSSESGHRGQDSQSRLVEQFPDTSGTPGDNQCLQKKNLRSHWLCSFEWLMSQIATVLFQTEGLGNSHTEL